MAEEEFMRVTVHTMMTSLLHIMQEVLFGVLKKMKTTHQS